MAVWTWPGIYQTYSGQCYSAVVLLSYKFPNLKAEFETQLDERVRDVVRELDRHCVQQGYPNLTLTEVFRTPEQSQAYYFKHQQTLKARYKAGRMLSQTDTLIAKLDDASAKKWARAKFSYHRANCAVDIRNSVYSPRQMIELMRFLETKCPLPLWEVLSHDVSNGAHIHCGIRSQSPEVRALKTKLDKEAYDALHGGKTWS